MAKHVEFTGKREYLFERNAVRFGAIVDGVPTWCIISEEAITAGGLPCSNALDLLRVFDQRFREVEAASRRRIDKADPNSEIVITRADLENG
ncbi:DUF1488 family protein [Planctomyces sp. SH-PL14]|uniref:DUF1488 family protein n=1 Tax=Planctomyces sp. SH-PL14 TaxID=1632864 RepID=UPI00078C6F84|nr:DUF1488 family protein [Planctomyces sp. SH-PL14]AMV16529.1 hypothetical protein VT03_01475 [Planctomyces sp. SH-PL14]